jgi:hypothetical protein
MPRPSFLLRRPARWRAPGLGLGLVLGLALGLLAAAPASASAIQQPCLSAATITQAPILGSVAGGVPSTYCQTAYGWSDAWFIGSQPSRYLQAADVLSGDDAPGLIWAHPGQTNPQAHGNSYGIFSPWIDRGTLNATYVGSAWSVVQDVAVTGAAASSAIKLGSGPAGSSLLVNIATSLVNGLQMTFTITNNTAQTFADLVFFDYFNFHPNGSLDVGCSSATGGAGGIVITGVPVCNSNSANPPSPLIANGQMYGGLPDGTPIPASDWTVGSVASVLGQIASGNLDNATSAGPGDVAGALFWNLGDLAPGASVQFAIFKNTYAPPPPPPPGFTPIPEPAGALVLLLGLAGLAASRRGVGRRA